MNLKISWDKKQKKVFIRKEQHNNDRKKKNMGPLWNNGLGAGGSGVVILRYLTASGTITIGAGLTGFTETDGSYKVITLTAGSGNVSWA